MLGPVVSQQWWQEHRDEVVTAYVLRDDGAPGSGVVVDLERWLSGPPSPADGRHPLPGCCRSRRCDGVLSTPARTARAMIADCGSGVTACHDLLVMEHVGLGTGWLYPARPAEVS